MNDIFAAANILVRGFINNPANIIVLRENQGNPLKLSLERFRSDLKKLIRENSPSPYGEIVQAMILGDQKEIPPEVMDKFNQTGTSHIIAISGFNVGIIAIFSIFLFRILMKSSEVLLLKFNIVKISNSPFVHPDCHLHIYRRNGGLRCPSYHHGTYVPRSHSPGQGAGSLQYTCPRGPDHPGHLTSFSV